MDSPDAAEKPRRRSERRQRTKLTAHRWFEAEFNRAAARADQAGLSFGAYIRAAALDDPGPRAQRRPAADHQALREILGQLGRIGNNLNQIARSLNAGERAALPELSAALHAYVEARNAIFEALGKTPEPGPEP